MKTFVATICITTSFVLTGAVFGQEAKEQATGNAAHPGKFRFPNDIHGGAGFDPELVRIVRMGLLNLPTHDNAGNPIRSQIPFGGGFGGPGFGGIRPGGFGAPDGNAFDVVPLPPAIARKRAAAK